MRTKTVLFYALAALMAGCVPVFSLHPLASPENLTFDERLLGTWEDEGGAGWEFLRMTPADANTLPDGLDAATDKLYRLRLSQDEHVVGDFVAALVKLGDTIVLDIFPQVFPSGRTDVETMELPFNGLFFIRAHTFIRIDEIGDGVKMSRTDDETFEKVLEAEPGAIACTNVDDRIVITAEPEAIRAFVSKHAAGDQLFTSEITLTRPKQN